MSVLVVREEEGQDGGPARGLMSRLLGLSGTGPPWEAMWNTYSGAHPPRGQGSRWISLPGPGHHCSKAIRGGGLQGTLPVRAACRRQQGVRAVAPRSTLPYLTAGAYAFPGTYMPRRC